MAGPNGAGKTTLTQRRPISELLADSVLLNADDKTLAELWKRGYQGFADAPHEVQQEVFINAANEVTEELKEHLRLGHKVCVETVLSTEKYKSIVTEVRQAGGFVGLIYVGLKSPDLSSRRIETRVALGGHDVPKDRLTARWHRSIQLLPWFVANAHRCWILDNTNSDSKRSAVLIAEGAHGKLTFHDRDAIPEITNALSHVQTEG
ncbi:MAG: hypothetical protein NT013_09555 [Planctomycetia bacterium]|nr:hypothetical protein [Planctomycetia bacterium]